MATSWILLLALLGLARGTFMSLPSVGTAPVLNAVNTVLSAAGTNSSVTTNTNEPVIAPGQTVQDITDKEDLKELLAGVSSGNLTAIYKGLWLAVGRKFCRNFGPDNGLERTQVGDADVSPGVSSWKNTSINQIGGGMACSRNCNGTCIPNDNDPKNSPFSLYPFACKCSAIGCNENGPIGNNDTMALAVGLVCVKHEDCTCNNIGDGDGSKYTGWLCNWAGELTSFQIKVIEVLQVLFGDSIPIYLRNPIINLRLNPVLSPIRWCECCPKNTASNTNSDTSNSNSVEE